MSVRPSVGSQSAAVCEESYVRIAGVSKRFGDFVAVDEVSLEVQRGEIFCLLGGSGSGKTTLLRLLAGFEVPSAGTIHIDGQDMSAVPPYQRPVNMMFQSYALFPHMTVEKNVAFGLEQENLSRAQIRQRVGEILEIVKMSGFLARKPHQLSGGQKQRVALARALAKRPKLLLLDEPLAALDRKLREHTQFELLNIQKQLGVTFIVVTHDQQEAMTLATRMGVMNHGKIAQVGTPADIYECPATKFVADFIGSVNMFEGEVLEGTPRSVRSRELGTTIPVGPGVAVSPGATVWIALRPEKIHISKAPPQSNGSGAHGRVTEVAYLGDMSVYLIEIESGKTLRVTRPNVIRSPEDRVAAGDPVYLSWHDSSPLVLTQ